MPDPQTIATTSSAWDAYVPSGATPWNLERVVHLHRRAGFAASWRELQRDLSDGPLRAVGRLLAGNRVEGDVRGVRNELNPSSPYTPPTTLPSFEVMADTIGDAATASGNPGRLKAWWFYRMLFSPDPLGERLTLMWHNHFATSNRKVQDLVQMREQNELLRRHARAPFGELLEAVVKHPAMLVWLDADSNRKGHPNENLARELMELFTLGIGNYDEADVKEAARALTGWTLVGKRFQFRGARHDDGEKRVLSVQGNLTGDDLLTLLLEHPATARRLAWRICRTFMGEGVVTEPALAELADGLRNHRLHIGWAVETVLRSKRFFSAENLRTRVVGPVEFVVGSLRALQLCEPPPSTLLLAEWAERMGQDLFYPPNVGGWKEGRAWLASRTIIARANFAQALAEGRLWHPSRAPDLDGLLERHSKKTSLDESVAWLARLLLGDALPSVVSEIVSALGTQSNERPLATAIRLLMARPEYQLA